MARPYMPLYVGDYLRDTRRLSLEEHGAYLLLMMEYWATGSLPENDEKFAKILGISRAKWFKLRETIKPFFRDDWTHKRIDEELALNAEKSKKRSDAASSRWAKTTDANAYANACANASVLHMQPNQTNVLDKSKTVMSETDVPDPNPKPKKTRNNYPEDFEAFWKAYPTDQNMSKVEAWTAWKALTPEEHEMAIRSVPSFLAYCAKDPKYRPIHANRYLLKKRFEGHAQSAEKVASITLISVKQESQAGRAWDEYTRATKGKGVPWTNGVWRFPTEFPPNVSNQPDMW